MEVVFSGIEAENTKTALQSTEREKITSNRIIPEEGAFGAHNLPSKPRKH